MEMKKKKNKVAYLSMSLLDISKILMCEFWYNCIKPKYQDNVKLCYMDTDSFIIYIITEDFYKDIANDVEKCFDISNYNEDYKRPLPRGMDKKVIGLFKDELGGTNMKEFVALRPKTDFYLMNDDSEYKKAKGRKKCAIKRETKFNDCKNCQFDNHTKITTKILK